MVPTIWILATLMTAAAADDATFSVVMEPPALLLPAPASVELRYRATREIPFLTTHFQWNILGGYTRFLPDLKKVVVKLVARDGLLRADGLEREAGGLSRWTLDRLAVRYGPYSIGVTRWRGDDEGPGPAVLAIDRPLRALGGDDSHLRHGTREVRVRLVGPVPGPRVEGVLRADEPVVVGAHPWTTRWRRGGTPWALDEESGAALDLPPGALAGLALPLGREVTLPLGHAFVDDGDAYTRDPSRFRLDWALVEERDLETLKPLATGADPGSVPVRRFEIDLETWDRLRRVGASRPGLSVAWGTAPGRGLLYSQLTVHARSHFAPVVLLIATSTDLQRSLRPEAIRLSPSTGEAAPVEPWDSAAWRDYKRAWRRADEASIVSTIDGATADRQALAPALASAAPREAPALLAALDAWLARRRERVVRSADTPAGAEALRLNRAALVACRAAAAALRSARWPDAWIEGTFAETLEAIAHRTAELEAELEKRGP